MTKYTITPRPYGVEIEGRIKWVPKVHIFIHEGDKTIDRVVTWKKNILFGSEEDARSFINGAIENLERINIQLRGSQIAALKAIAEEQGQSVAEVIRQAITKSLPSQED